MRKAFTLLGPAILALLALANTAGAGTRTIDCGIFACDYPIDCGRHLEPVCGNGQCDSGYVKFNLPSEYWVNADCPGFPCNGNSYTFTSGCYDPTDPPTCNECSAEGQFQCGAACGGACDPGLTPATSGSNAGHCVPCGGEGEPICQDGDPTCDPGLNRAGNRCYADCGGAGEIVCPNLQCQEWHFEAAPGLCAACGGAADHGPPPGSTQVACPGLVCRPDYELQAGLCSNCGQDQEVECGLGDTCRDGAQPIGPDKDGYRVCSFCGGPGEIACESSACEGSLMHITDAPLSGDIDDCLVTRTDNEKHFLKQNGFCSNAYPDPMTRTAPESWPVEEEPFLGRGTIFLIHGRGSSCGASSDTALDGGHLYDAGHLTYCVEYDQEVDLSRVRIIPVKGDVNGIPQQGCAPGVCEFDTANPVATTFAAISPGAVPSVNDVVDALFDGMLQVPIEGDVTMIGHSQGGFITRQLVYEHYDALRWAGRKIERVVNLAHPHYTKHADPHLYSPWFCNAGGDGFDCSTGRWTWGWDLYAPGAATNADYPQIEWVSASGAGVLGWESEDANADGTVNAVDDACMYNFGGVWADDVLYDSSVPIESSLGYDEFGFFQVQTLDYDRRYHGTGPHGAWYMLDDMLNDPPECVPGSGVGSAVDSCQGEERETLAIPTSLDRLRAADVLELDGVDDIVTIGGNAPSLLDFDNEMTIEVWVKPEGDGVFVSKEGEYWLGRNANDNLIWAIDDGNWVGVTSSHVLPDAEWAHVALTFEAGNEVALYVNGDQVETWAAGGAIGDYDGTATGLDIGRRSGGSQAYDGMLDDLRLWNRAFDASEVRTLVGDYPTSFQTHLRAWYRFDDFDDFIPDSSGWGLHGSLSMAGPASTPIRKSPRRLDKPGGALYLDGVDDRAITHDPAAIARLEMEHELTMEGWMFLRSYAFATMIVANASEYWLAASNGGRVGFALANSSPGWTGVYSDYYMPLRTWTHVALTYENDPATDDATATLYINGQFEQQWAMNGPLGEFDSADVFQLGGQNNTNGIHGAIDDVRVWSVARSAQQIADNHNRTLAWPTSEFGLAGYWDFDERIGPFVFDRSGNGNHLTLGDGTPGTEPVRSMATHLPTYRLIYDGVCGDALLHPMEQCDDGLGYGGNGCSDTCRIETVFEIMGTPQGGSVSLDIAGVTISVTTTAGESAADVAAAIASAINADATLWSLGITAVANGDQVLIGGEFTNPVIDDPGLMDCATADFPIITGDTANFCPETAVVLSTDSGQIAYQWLFEGEPIEGATEATFTVTLTGEYSVRVTDASGCDRESFPELTFVSFCPETEISPVDAIFPLEIAKDAGSTTGYYVSFQHVEGVDGFHLYTGSLGSWYDHGTTASCDIHFDFVDSGQVRSELTVDPLAAQYFLVTGYQRGDEGPAGSSSDGTERDPAQQVCHLP